MNKEKIIDAIINLGLILILVILIVLACLIFGFAPFGLTFDYSLDADPFDFEIN